MFALACDALVRERDRVFLERICADYNLSFEELSAKYLETAEEAIKVTRKYTKKAKDVTIVTEDSKPKAPKAPVVKQCCTSQTSKKEPCKFSALKGEVFCLRHLKQSRGDAPTAEPKIPKTKKVVKTEPIHTHPIDVESPTKDCDTCAKYGKPLMPTPVEFEKVETKTAAQRLAEMLEEADSDSEDETEEGGMVIDEEAFEED